MSMPRISMELQKEIQFLKPKLKYIRAVAKHLGIHRETVSKYGNITNACMVESSSGPSWAKQVDWSYIQ